MEQKKGMFYALISSAAYGMMPFLVKYAYGFGVNTETVLFYRYFFAALVLSVFLFFQDKSIRINKEQLLPILWGAIIGTGGTSFTLFLSYDYLATGTATTLHFVYPVIVTFLSLLIFKEKLGKFRIIALTCSLFGIFLLSDNKGVGLNLTGMFWALLSGLLYASYVISVAHKEVRKMEPLVLTFYITLFTSLTFLCTGMVSGNLNFAVGFKALPSLFAVAFIATFFPVIMFFKGLKLIGPSKSAIMSTMEPIVSVIIGCFLLSESMTFTIAAGSLCIICSVLLITTENSWKSKIVKLRKYSRAA